MQNNSLVGIFAVIEIRRRNIRFHLFGVFRIFAHNQNKRLHRFNAVIDGIIFQPFFNTLMIRDAVRKHHLIYFILREIIVGDVAPSHRVRRLCKSIFNGGRKRILIDNIFEFDRLCSLLHLRSSSQFKSQNRLQFIDCRKPFVCTIMVGFVHQDNHIFS